MYIKSTVVVVLVQYNFPINKRRNTNLKHTKSANQ